MAEKLSFSLVSPERELFSGAVDEVIAPGSAGEFTVLPRHAPFMTTMRTGLLRIREGGQERAMFVEGGFADVTAAGLTVLAERAVDLATVDAAALDQDIRAAGEALKAATEGERAAREAALRRLEALRAALG